MRRQTGISALSRHTTQTTSFAALSSTISTSQLTSLQSSLSQFRDSLTAFAIAHREDIRSDPAFRHQFQKMCAAIGVDPLAGSVRGGGAFGGVWTEKLGLGETVYEISVQVVDVCISTRGSNGGMIELGELRARVERMRGGGKGGKGGIGAVGENDILRAIELLRPLHAGYTIHQVGPTRYVRSVPRELDTDQSALLNIAATTGGRLSGSMIKRLAGWTDVRATQALEDCVMREGMGWVDDQAGTGEREVWLIAAVSFDDGA